MANSVAALTLAALLSSCAHHRPASPPPTHATYTLGAAYEAGGAWRYPAERFEFEETGLASVIPTHKGPTTDGELYDPQAMAGEHPTLQLPAIVRVTALATGRQILIRLNERGPADPGRILALTPRAASLLGVTGAALAVRLEVDSGLSRRLADQLGGGSHLAISTAPREAVTAETLPAPGQAAGAAKRGVRTIGPLRDDARVDLVPDRLAETVTQVPPSPASLYLRGSDFGRASYAREEAARLGGIGAEVVTDGQGHGARYVVRAGPFGSVEEADRALRAALAAGVTDARIVAEQG